jgi:acyl-CoA thioesterase FadM
LVKVAIDFLAPTRFDDEIEAHIRVYGVGRSSITFLVEIFSKDSEKILEKGEVVWAILTIKPKSLYLFLRNWWP